MIIRPCKKEDLETIFLIEKNSFESGAWTYEQIEYEFEKNDYAHIYVVEEGKVFGYIDFWVLFEQGTISKIAILPLLRRKGVGCILLNDAINRMISQNVESITLEVRVSNIAAIKLYEKLGFKTLIIKNGYYSDGEDAYLMELKVGELNG